MIEEDFTDDGFIDEDKDLYEKRKSEYEDEQYNSAISSYSLGLSDSDFF